MSRKADGRANYSKPGKAALLEMVRSAVASLPVLARANGIDASMLAKWVKDSSRSRVAKHAAAQPKLIPVVVGQSAAKPALAPQPVPPGTRVWVAAGFTEMRKGFNGLSAIAQLGLQAYPYSGHAFVFRDKRGDLIKLLWRSGDGISVYAKSLEPGRFVWPQAVASAVHLGAAQLSMLLEGVDWRTPQRSFPLKLAVCKPELHDRPRDVG